MKKIIGLIFASLVVVFCFSADSSAQTRHRSWSVNSREARQQTRIYQGARTGSLTAKETYRLERQQAQIRRQEARYRSSGNGLSARERYKLEHRLNQTNRNIYHQKHDRQKYGYPPRQL